MEEINKTKSISIWIFIIPFVAVNACLLIITHFHGLFPNQEDVIGKTLTGKIKEGELFSKQHFSNIKHH